MTLDAEIAIAYSAFLHEQGQWMRVDPKTSNEPWIAIRRHHVQGDPRVRIERLLFDSWEDRSNHILHESVAAAVTALIRSIEPNSWNALKEALRDELEAGEKRMVGSV